VHQAPPWTDLGVALWWDAGEERGWSPGSERILGCPVARMPRDDAAYLASVEPAQQNALAKVLRQPLRDGAIAVLRYLFTPAGGQPRLIEERIHSPVGAPGRRWGLCMLVAPTSHEASQMASVQQAVAVGEHRFQAVLDGLADAVLALDASGLVLRANGPARSLLGRDPTGQRLPENLLALDDLRRCTARGGGLLPERRLGPLHDPSTISISASPLEGDLTLLVLRDISEARRLEDRVRQAEKMDCLGQMAGGVAHDFNNILATIVGSLDVLERNGADQAHSPTLQRMRLASEHANHLVRDLLAFARNDRLPAQDYDAHDAVERAVELLRHLLGPDCTLTLDLSAERSGVRGDPHQLQGAIMNLVVNARDAMGGSGCISVHSSQRAADSDFPDGGLAIAVSDQGPGVPAEIRDRIFEPFFTTKPAGKGTGLGLSAVYGTAQAHGGRVTLDSPPGQGATFIMLLPLVTVTRSITARQERSSARQLASLRILLAEDDDLVREMAQEMLNDLGHQVLVVADGAQAVTAVQQRAGAFDAVILDQVMPRLDGHQALRSIQAIAPELPVILASGYAQGATADGLLAAGFAAVLAKPYQSKDMQRALNHAMGFRG
jgi:signal transduction histidine kinase/ActR/RegA family two-component response regulator